MQDDSRVTLDFQQERVTHTKREVCWQKQESRWKAQGISVSNCLTYALLNILNQTELHITLLIITKEALYAS